MTKLLFSILTVSFSLLLPAFSDTNLLQKENVQEKGRALFARIAGEWSYELLVGKYNHPPYNISLTLSRTGNRLLVSRNYTKYTDNSIEIYSIDTVRRLLRHLEMVEHPNILGNEPISVPLVARVQFGRFGPSDDVLWMMHDMQPFYVSQMRGDKMILDMIPGKIEPFDLHNSSIGSRWTRVASKPQNGKSEGFQGELKEERRIMARLDGDWTEENTRNTTTSSAVHKKVLFTLSGFGRRLLGEYPDNPHVMHILGAIPIPKKQYQRQFGDAIRSGAIPSEPFRGFFWWQIIETDNPVKPDLIGMIGTVNPTEDVVLWKKNGQPVELWHFPDPNTVLRLSPAKDDPFDVKKGVLLSRWVREKKAEPGGKP